MKKLLSVISLLILLPAVASASTVYFSPQSISITEGQTFSVTLIVDPQGSAYTVKVSVSFPPNLLSVASFSQASGWMPLSQPGYDVVDNSGGTLVKTAGAAGGISAPQAFGTITFMAKSSGTAQIAVTGATQILNSSNQDTFTGGGQSTVTISYPAVSPGAGSIISAPVTQPAISKPKTSPARNLMAGDNLVTSSSATASSTATSTVESTELVAQASSGKPFPINYIIPLATLLLGFAIGRFYHKSL